MSAMTATVVHVTIERPLKEVYAFASDPENMPLWASGLASGLEPLNDSWIATGPLGKVVVHFVEQNRFGVIDHVVTMPDGLKVYNALRVIPNGSGAEVCFTLLQLPGMSDEDFKRDADLVRDDLATLKNILENPNSLGNLTGPILM